mmetsp:Transcript_27860/g.65479  ORF Transcript_27860/g.65479 Transcript_27860/m.65479 type:complete len:283 (-) Transcript_27860:515-1363(-)
MPPPPTLNVSALAEGSAEARLLSLVHRFDDLTGAPNWAQSSLLIGAATVAVLFTVKKIVGGKSEVNWVSMVHSIIVGFMSAVAVWLNVFAAESLTGTTEPLGQVLCQGPITTFHSIVPAVTMGYGLFDIAEGMRLAKTEFILHGIATWSVMSYFCFYGVPEIILPMLLMEISTTHLTLMSSPNLLSPTMAIINILFFVITFTVSRIIICPYLWWGIVVAEWENRDNPVSQACLPWHFVYVSFAFGMFFNCLNTFWYYKIIKKLQRKFSGTESWEKKNHVKES